MNRSTPPLRQVLLAYALLGSILAAAWFAAGQPLMTRLAQGNARIATLAARVDTLEQAAARDAALRSDIAGEQIERLRAFIRRATVDAETLQVGGSLLQRRLTAIIEEHGGIPGNIRVATDPDTAMMTVSARFAADLPDLAAVLFDVARAERPLMFVDLLSIRRRDQYLNLEGADRAGNTDLVIQLDISAFSGSAPANGSG